MSSMLIYIPGRKEILDGMLGANLVCFQVRPTRCSIRDPYLPTPLDLLIFQALFVHVCARVWIRNDVAHGRGTDDTR